jgi:hypothetical protein
MMMDAGAPGLTLSNFPGSKQAKAFPMPTGHGGGLDEKETGRQFFPDLT